MIVYFSMTRIKNEYFGGPAGQFVQERSELLWSLVKDDPRYCCHGRGISLAGIGDGDAERLVSLAKLAGVGVCDLVPSGKVDELRSMLEERGLKTDRMEVWRSGKSTVSTAQEMIKSHSLPPDIDLVFVNPDTEISVLRGLDEFTQEHGAMLPMGSFFAKQTKPDHLCIWSRQRWAPSWNFCDGREF